MTFPLWALKGWGILKSIPWQIWAVLGLAISFHLWGAHQYDNGRESVLAELRKQEAQAERVAEAARQSASEKAQERAEKFETQQEALQDAIKNAENNGGNALDDLIGLWGED